MGSVVFPVSLKKKRLHGGKRPYDEMHSKTRVAMHWLGCFWSADNQRLFTMKVVGPFMGILLGQWRWLATSKTSLFPQPG